MKIISLAVASLSGSIFLASCAQLMSQQAQVSIWVKPHQLSPQVSAQNVAMRCTSRAITLYLNEMRLQDRAAAKAHQASVWSLDCMWSVTKSS